MRVNVIAPDLFGDPLRHLGPAPQAAARRRALKRRRQLDKLGRVQQRARAGIAVAPVAQGRRAASVVAMHQLLDPTRRVPARCSNLGQALAARQQPDDLQLAALDPIRRRPITLEQRRSVQMSYKLYSLGHDHTISWVTAKRESHPH